MNTTYSFPPYMNIDEDGNATPIESPRDRLIREMSVAAVQECEFATHLKNRLIVIRDHANELYPPE